jgi:hypothetical protein
VTTAYIPPYTPPSIGDIVYLASALFRVRVGALTTNYDTPNQYTAELKVMGDQGDFSLDGIRGATGPAGQQTFAFRRQDDADVNSSADLPKNLTNSPEDIGKYWLIDTVNGGLVTMETAWTWYGTEWRTFMMGIFGPPGPVPEITVGENLIDPSKDAYVDGGGSTLQPTWELYLPQPAGIPGPVGPMYLFPDVDTTPPSQYDLLAFMGEYNDLGQEIWQPFSIQGLLPQPWTMPEASFHAYTGISQRAFIGSFSVPPQPFDWTPVVWGHIGETGFNLSADPFLIGCQVLLGDQVANFEGGAGIQVARGLGSILGRVFIVPHYSNSANTNQVITPANNYAVVPANHTGNQGTVYINLWNDGMLGIYFFEPGGAQLYIQAVPIEVAKSLAAASRSNP